MSFTISSKQSGENRSVVRICFFVFSGVLHLTLRSQTRMCFGNRNPHMCLRPWNSQRACVLPPTRPMTLPRMCFFAHHRKSLQCLCLECTCTFILLNPLLWAQNSIIQILHAQCSCEAFFHRTILKLLKANKKGKFCKSSNYVRYNFLSLHVQLTLEFDNWI